MYQEENTRIQLENQALRLEIQDLKSNMDSNELKRDNLITYIDEVLKANNLTLTSPDKDLMNMTVVPSEDQVDQDAINIPKKTKMGTKDNVSSGQQQRPGSLNYLRSISGAFLRPQGIPEKSKEHSLIPSPGFEILLAATNPVISSSTPLDQNNMYAHVDQGTDVLLAIDNDCDITQRLNQINDVISRKHARQQDDENDKEVIFILQKKLRKLSEQNRQK